MTGEFVPPTASHLPVGLGASISHIRGGPGSIGPVVRTADGSDWFFLSASHVLAPTSAVKGDEVIQPAVAHSGSVPIAVLVDFEPLKPGAVMNRFDAAIARIINKDDVVPRLQVIGDVDGNVIEPRKFASVRKFGAATSHTVGVILNPSTDADFIFDGEEYHFDEVIEVAGCGGSFSEGGDSGALVVDALSQRALGLIIVGRQGKTFVSPLGRILERFGCRLLTRDESQQ